MAGKNESNINETTSVENCDDSNIMNNVEILSTPNVSQENKTKNNANETNSTDDSGIQITPKSSRESKNNKMCIRDSLCSPKRTQK